MTRLSQQTQKALQKPVHSAATLERHILGLERLAEQDPDFVRKTLRNMEIPEPVRHLMRALLAGVEPANPALVVAPAPTSTAPAVKPKASATKRRTRGKVAAAKPASTAAPAPTALPTPAPAAVETKAGSGKPKRVRDTYGVYWLANNVLKNQFGQGRVPTTGASIQDALAACYPDGWQKVKIARGGGGSVKTNLGDDLVFFYGQLKDAIVRLKLAVAGDLLDGKKPGEQILGLAETIQFAGERAVEIERVVTAWGANLGS